MDEIDPREATGETEDRGRVPHRGDRVLQPGEESNVGIGDRAGLRIEQPALPAQRPTEKRFLSWCETQ